MTNKLRVGAFYLQWLFEKCVYEIPEEAQNVCADLIAEIIVQAGGAEKILYAWREFKHNGETFPEELPDNAEDDAYDRYREKTDKRGGLHGS